MFSCGGGVRRGLIVIFPFPPGLDLFSFLQTESQVSSQTSEESSLDTDGIVFPCPVSLGISKCFPVGGEGSSLSPYSSWHFMFTPVPSRLPPCSSLSAHSPLPVHTAFPSGCSTHWRPPQGQELGIWRDCLRQGTGERSGEVGQSWRGPPLFFSRMP